MDASTSAEEPEFYTFREGSAWICAWRRFDIVAQGSTEEEACERMLRSIAAHAIDCAIDGISFSSHPKPTPELLDAWRCAHERTHAPDQ